MARLLDLSAELLLCIASYTRHVDLLNVSLTCKHLRAVTEPELFRAYSNPKDHCRPIPPFVTKLIQRPELTRYVRRLKLKAWRTLYTLHPKMFSGTEDFDRHRNPEPTAAEYELLTEAAKHAGVIESVFPYETDSRIINEARMHVQARGNRRSSWAQHLFDPQIPTSCIPYDRKFCQLLRAGLEDPYVVLLVALLPNVQEIHLRGAPHDLDTLPWKAPLHRFQALRTLSAQSMDDEMSWPLAFFNDLLSAEKLENFHCYLGSSGWRPDVGRPVVEKLIPLKLHPGLLSLQRLTLQYCTITRDEMQKLLNACCRLRSLFYSGGDEDVGPGNFTPAELMELLEPHKDSLEELYLELYPQGEWDSHSGCLAYLNKFTSLQVLDTVPEMWAGFLLLEDSEWDQNADDSDDTTNLCGRLPKSLEMLIFPKGKDYEVMSCYQIRELFRHRRTQLPNLQALYVYAEEAAYIDALDHIYEDYGEDLARSAQEDPEYSFDFLVLGRDAPSNPTLTVFQSQSRTEDLPETNWTGIKYARMRRKKPPYFEAFERLEEEHGEELDEMELVALTQQLPVIQELHTDGIFQRPMELEEDEGSDD